MTHTFTLAIKQKEKNLSLIRTKHIVLKIKFQAHTTLIIHGSRFPTPYQFVNQTPLTGFGLSCKVRVI